ncbi:PREDICTED: zinc finger A20 and AN1 domain-containing stress-associated protein 2-like [Tarenaya hassleriana]|uniref:zinc finger A20 and AN1 domain-containing stress-associated protein 2-like n=1 Tax=Tarenaya hassleriana TaxID=28532 RepID=UPI00053C6A13|nr:PREDICTED: zinc finger A20 and AN1 domain-containing stress-associated protein 2-like [Tarenaya hassleriana]
MEHDETGCQTPPDCPKLCIKNCGFFGSSATMNMCSKCHRAMSFQQEQQAKLASVVSGSSSSSVIIITVKKTVSDASVDAQAKPVDPFPYDYREAGHGAIAKSEPGCEGREARKNLNPVSKAFAHPSNYSLLRSVIDD